MGDIKRIPKTVYIVSLMVAGIADYFNFVVSIPFLGDITIVFLRLTFYLLGYGGKNRSMITGLVIEAIPYVSLLPGCMMFVSRFYADNLIETKGQKAR